MRRGTAAAAVTLSAAALLGCSYGARPASGPPTSVPPTPSAAMSDPAVIWTNQVCDALLPVAQLSRTAPSPDTSDLAASRQRFHDYLVAQLAALDRAVAQINEAGPAPVDNGQQLTGPLTAALMQLRTRFADALARLDAVPVNDPTTLSQTLQGIANLFVVAGDGPTLDDLALPPVLAQAAQRAPGCRALDQASTPSPTPPPGSTPSR